MLALSNKIVTFESAARTGFRLLLSYAYLQVLDVLSTLAFLLAGVQEANPVVRLFMHQTGSPLIGLICIKLLAMMLGFACWHTGRFKLLGRANIFFGGLVAWNLLCLTLGLAGRPHP